MKEDGLFGDSPPREEGMMAVGEAAGHTAPALRKCKGNREWTQRGTSL